MMTSRNQKQQRAFTLVETLVAITVLVIAIVGPLYAVHRSIIASYTARDTLIATALAQEGMEYIRSVRDSNYLATQSDWLEGLDLCITTTGCAIDPSASGLSTQIQAFATSSAILRFDSEYRHRLGSSGTTPTRFIRKVTITAVSNTEVEVTSQVYWLTLRIPYSVTVTEHLYDWQ